MVTGGRVKDGLPTTGESPIADYMAAALLAFGVAAALLKRERTGRGGRVDTSLLLAALALQNTLMVRVDAHDGRRHTSFLEWLDGARRGGVPFAEQVERMPRNRVLSSQAIYVRTYATKDAALAVACGSPSLRRKFIAAVGHQDPAIDGRVPDVDAHYGALRAAVEATIASRTTREWTALLEAAGVPASDVALPIEMLDHEQPAANAMFHRFDHPALGPVTVLGPPVQVGDAGFTPGPPTAAFGSETRAILEWAGFSAPDVDRLISGGAVTPK
jgi:crotonobetainyl-CoA:carnitine CoA-transferase CaiB-like acyl-CoA transferase